MSTDNLCMQVEVHVHPVVLGVPMTYHYTKRKHTIRCIQQHLVSESP